MKPKQPSILYMTDTREVLDQNTILIILDTFLCKIKTNDLSHDTLTYPFSPHTTPFYARKKQKTFWQRRVEVEKGFSRKRGSKQQTTFIPATVYIVTFELDVSLLLSRIATKERNLALFPPT